MSVLDNIDYIELYWIYWQILIWWWWWC